MNQTRLPLDAGTSLPVEPLAVFPNPYDVSAVSYTVFVPTEAIVAAEISPSATAVFPTLVGSSSIQCICTD
jgi:hypothetical protein